MAAPSSAPSTGTDGAGRPTLSLARKVQFGGFAALVVVAVVFYLWWGLSYGVWLDNGVYAVVIVLLLFGLTGMWLVLPNPPVSAESP